MFPVEGNFYLRLPKARWHRLEKDPCEFLRSDSWEFARVCNGFLFIKRERIMSKTELINTNQDPGKEAPGTREVQGLVWLG